MNPSQTLPPRVERLRDVVARVGMSRASIYRRLAVGGDFPKPFRLGPDNRLGLSNYRPLDQCPDRRSLKVMPMNRGPKLDSFLTITAVARRLGVHPRTVRRWIDQGHLPAHRVGAVVRISEADAASFMAAHRM